MSPLTDLHKRTLTPQSWPDMLREFDAKFRHHARDKPGIPPDGVVALRSRLLHEEFRELIEAIWTPNGGDVAGVAKEAAELIHATIGAMLAYGLDPDEAFREVHSAKMTGNPVDVSQKS